MASVRHRVAIIGLIETLNVITTIVIVTTTIATIVMTSGTIIITTIALRIATVTTTTGTATGMTTKGEAQLSITPIVHGMFTIATMMFITTVVTTHTFRTVVDDGL